MMGRGSTSLRALDISKCTARLFVNNGRRITGRRPTGECRSTRQRLSTQARNCAAAPSSGAIAALERKRCSKTQFCGRVQKLLPKVTLRVVLSASKKKSAAAIAIPTSKMMRTDLLLRQTRMHFPRLDVDRIKIKPIEKGGSDRKFYRIRCSPHQTLILVKYNLEREENQHYVQIARFLDAHGIRVPKIYFHDATEGLIWIEDLGERDLFSYRSESWLLRRAFYESALDQIAALHGLPESACIEIKEDLPAEFNAELYVWEQNYFFENSLGRYFGIDKAQWRELAALPPLRKIAERLARLSRVLVHRDFQSQNIIIRNSLSYLIDFQGMRPGLPEYDLASLLFDPYVDLSKPW